MSYITVEDFQRAINDQVSASIRARITEAKLEYKVLAGAERDKYILSVLEALIGDNLAKSGEHRQDDWDKGWHENLSLLVDTQDLKTLIPKYHSKQKIVHWMQDVVKTATSDFDFKIHEWLVDYVFEKYFSSCAYVYEFGCGPAYHLLRLRKINPKAQLVGLDWAISSQDIISNIKKMGLDTNIEGHNFNFFYPDYSICIPDGSGVYTVAALEQVGARFEPFLKYLLEKRPSICVHLEPIDELLDSKVLVDRLSQLYFRKRNYLTGFLTRLRQLEAEGKLTIHRCQRTYTGSYFIEGHSMIVWSPNLD